jgi:hypothetical protein
MEKADYGDAGEKAHEAREEDQTPIMLSAEASNNSQHSCWTPGATFRSLCVKVFFNLKVKKDRTHRRPRLVSHGLRFAMPSGHFNVARLSLSSISHILIDMTFVGPVATRLHWPGQRWPQFAAIVMENNVRISLSSAVPMADGRRGVTLEGLYVAISDDRHTAAVTAKIPAI